MMMRELKDIGRVYGDLKAISCSGFSPDHPLWHKYHTPPGIAELDTMEPEQRERVTARLEELQAGYKHDYEAMHQDIKNLMVSIDTYMSGHKTASSITLSDVLEGGRGDGIR